MVVVKEINGTLREIPLPEGCREATSEDLAKLAADKQIKESARNEAMLKNKLNNLRLKRTRLLSAFDKWEKAVLRGREEDDEDIMDWYYSILDLNESSINNVPNRVKYYL